MGRVMAMGRVMVMGQAMVVEGMGQGMEVVMGQVMVVEGGEVVGEDDGAGMDVVDGDSGEGAVDSAAVAPKKHKLTTWWWQTLMKLTLRNHDNNL